MNANNFEANSNSQAEAVNEWVRLGLRLGVSAALHPFEYSKVLIQLGYEPVPPRPGRTFLGQRALILPNIFQYVGHLRRIDGFFGCYRGLTPKIIGSIVGSLGSEKLVEKLGLLPVADESKSNSELTEEEEYIKFQTELKRDIIIQISGIIITQPFQVISVRMMAQFIGRETTYNSTIGSMIEIFKNDGILGFFSGVIPKILCEVACITLTSATIYLVNKHFIKERHGRTYFASFAQFLYTSIFYPLRVVSTCMSVTGSGLCAGQPPHMPIYSNWLDCWHDLSTRGELKRGGSIFWRTVRTTTNYNKYNFAPLPKISKYN